jgi:hypothetical protein
MNEIYKKRRIVTEDLPKKLGCKVYKEGVGLFGQNYPMELSAEAFIDRILHEKSILLQENYFGSNGGHSVCFVC